VYADVYPSFPRLFNLVALIKLFISAGERSSPIKQVAIRKYRRFLLVSVKKIMAGISTEKAKNPKLELITKREHTDKSTLNTVSLPSSKKRQTNKENITKAT
jgi:hypothetical protein